MDAEMNRIRGAFFGQLIGDSFGSRYEFKPRQIVHGMLKKDAQNGHVPLLGGGVFKRAAGQLTDDSEMALSLATSLVRCRGFDRADVACSYARWLQTDPPDAGMATTDALSIRQQIPSDWTIKWTAEQKAAVLSQIDANVQKSNGGSLSNGLLMRISPLGIAMRKCEPEKIVETVAQETTITHGNPIAVEAAQFYVLLLAKLLNGKNPQTAIDESRMHLKSQVLSAIVDDSATHATPVRLPDGRTIPGDREKQGYLGVALQASLYELRKASSFAEGLVRIVGLGGDTDTNGCIGAALLGARFGEDGIPADWKEAVINAPIDRDFDFMQPLKSRSLDEFITKLSSVY